MNSMSSGCAAIATARRTMSFDTRRLVRWDLRQLHRPSLRSGPVGGGDDPVRREPVAEAGERHVFPLVQRVEKRLELCLVGMITYIAAVEELHREVAPGIPIQACQLLGMELVVEDAAVASHEVRVKVVGLKTIDDRRALAHAAIAELEDAGRRRPVLVRREERIRARGRVAGDFLDI